MYSVFDELPSINTQTDPSEIRDWKQMPAVKKCYKSLFRKINPDLPATYMSKIVEKLRKDDKKPSKIQIAYAISICEVYLCPDNPTIQINDVVKSRITENLVS